MDGSLSGFVSSLQQRSSEDGTFSQMAIKELCQKTLVLWTIEGLEPWIEVLEDGETFRVCEGAHENPIRSRQNSKLMLSPRMNVYCWIFYQKRNLRVVNNKVSFVGVLLTLLTFSDPALAENLSVLNWKEKSSVFSERSGVVREGLSSKEKHLNMNDSNLIVFRSRI